MTVYLKVGAKFTKLNSSSFASTSGAWADRSMRVKLTAGKHNIAIYPNSAITVSSFKFDSDAAGIGDIAADDADAAPAEIYDLRGISLGTDTSSLTPGIYVVKTAGDTSLRLIP